MKCSKGYTSIVATLALDTTNDLLVTSGRLLVISGPEATAQKLTTSFQLFKGEWFLDTRIGVPWFDQVLVKAPDLEWIRRLFRRVCLSVQGVATVESIELNYDASSRSLACEISVKHDSGAIIVGGPGAPFIVTGAA